MGRGSLIALLSAAVLAAGCTGARAPRELAGLWSAGPAACAAGVGVRFRNDAIEAVYDRQVETLFEHPRYHVEEGGEGFRVRVTYELPRLAGGARSVGAHGVLVLARQPNGKIAPMRHTLVDPRTGAARMRIAGDPAARLLTLEPCGPDHPWRQGIRGRT
ncbi:MAG: hypothetical protein AB7O98_04605 [Hyphomonadaceae bacterium]